MESVIELDIGCLPELAVSEPVVMATDQRMIFCFNATRRKPDGRRAAAGRAVVRVGSCLAFKLGYPNDEARPGHPLFSRGFDGTAVCEVLGSSWVTELARQNRAPFPTSDLSRWGVRHFLFAFHDSTLEVLGRDLEVSLSEDPLDTVLCLMQTWLLPAATQEKL